MMGEWDWAKTLVARRATVMHVETQTIGVVKHFYDGVDDKFMSSINGAEVDAPIIEFHEGNAFLAQKEGGFVELSDGENAYQAIARAQVDGVVRLLTSRETIVNINSSPQAASIILISTLNSMLNKLRAAHDRRFGAMGGPSDVG